MEVIVSESGKGKLSQTITIGQHVLTADESIQDGGNDLGPNPYDYLLSALGACTAMTIRMYANRHEIPVKHICVVLQHEKIYAKDCADCESETSKIDHINRQIELDGELTEDQRKILLSIANKCPVHRTLTSKIFITTQLIRKK